MIKGNIRSFHEYNTTSPDMCYMCTQQTDIFFIEILSIRQFQYNTNFDKKKNELMSSEYNFETFAVTIS